MNRLPNLADHTFADSTKQLDRTAMNHLDKFLSCHYPSDLLITRLTSEDVNESLLGEFATYLLSEQRLSSATTTVYICSIKRLLQDATQTEFFIEKSWWYKRLRILGLRFDFSTSTTLKPHTTRRSSSIQNWTAVRRRRTTSIGLATN